MADNSQDTASALEIPNLVDKLVSVARGDCSKLGLGLTVTNPGAASTGNPEESEIGEHGPATPPGGTILPGGIISVVIRS